MARWDGPHHPRGVDLAEVKARRAEAERSAAEQQLLTWGAALADWLSDPLEEDQVDERVIKVPLTGEQLVLSRRRA